MHGHKYGILDYSFFYLQPLLILQEAAYCVFSLYKTLDTCSAVLLTERLEGDFVGTFGCSDQE